MLAKLRHSTAVLEKAPAGTQREAVLPRGTVVWQCRQGKRTDEGGICPSTAADVLGSDWADGGVDTVGASRELGACPQQGYF